jgi:hypothetical protein
MTVWRAFSQLVKETPEEVLKQWIMAFRPMSVERECNINCVSKKCVRFLTHTVFYLVE